MRISQGDKPMNSLSVKAATTSFGVRSAASSIERSGVSDSAQWYVVLTKPKHEFRALQQLENQNYQCFLPTIILQKIARGRLIAITEPLFSRYLFIRLDTATSAWSPIRSTRGVSGLVAFGTRFATLEDSCIEALQQRARVHAKAYFSAGETVEITEGPFAGLDGLYQIPDGETRALVLIEMMHQPQKLSFSIASLRKAF
jgi:transcriptional antiterminator RfaH